MYQFQCIEDREDGITRYEAYYEGGYAAIDYRYHQRAWVVFSTGVNVPDETDLLAAFIDWVW